MLKSKNLLEQEQRTVKEIINNLQQHIDPPSNQKKDIVQKIASLCIETNTNLEKEYQKISLTQRSNNLPHILNTIKDYKTIHGKLGNLFGRLQSAAYKDTEKDSETIKNIKTVSRILQSAHLRLGKSINKLQERADQLTENPAPSSYFSNVPLYFIPNLTYPISQPTESSKETYQ